MANNGANKHISRNKDGKIVFSDSLLRDLRAGFSFSLTDKECCLYAGIGTTSLYDYCKQNPQFAEQKELLKKKPSINAKMNVVKSLSEGNVEDSRKRLKAKNKEEFSDRVDLHNTGDVKANVTLSDKDRLLLDKIAEGHKKKKKSLFGKND